MARKYKGQTVTNSSKGLRINITPKDIEKGTPLDPENCAAAQTILRSTGAHAVSVHRGYVYIQLKDGGRYQKFRTSSGLRLETIVFDRGGTFMQGEYDLQPVPISVIAPKKRKGPSVPRSKKEMELAVRRRTIPGVRRSARSTTEENKE